jgi:cytochrome c oxidase accessory protein FixG
MEQIVELRGSLDADGKRRRIVPAEVRGRFTRIRTVGFVVLIAVYAALPWIRIAGHPAVFLDLAHRRFHLFGASFNAQDTWLLFFLLAGVGAALITATALLGRIWCGYACPQTVFLEGVFRRIERWFDGPPAARRRRAGQPLSAARLARAAGKHAAYIAFSALVAHVFISYFVSLPELFAMMAASPAEHPAAFGWAFGLTALTYGNFAWFREQTCLIVCPYGRLQSTLTDADTLIIGYDQARGEPRGKLKRAPGGDCIDCNRCVAVCPTGIDIRSGLQIECIGCAACIDACDEIMVRIGRKPGLIRYDSARGLGGEERRVWRPRLALYALLLFALAGGAVWAAGAHHSFEANLLRAPGMPFIKRGDRVRNSFELHLVNKSDRPTRFTVAPVGGVPALEVRLVAREVELAGGEATSIAIFAEMPAAGFRPGAQLALRIASDAGGESRTVTARLLGPGPPPR